MSERVLSLLNLSCEVAALISCSQTCFFFFFFCSQHIRGCSALLALESMPHHGLCPHASTGAHMLHMVDEQVRRLTCCEKGFHFLKALPQTNKDNSYST